MSQHTVKLKNGILIRDDDGIVCGTLSAPRSVQRLEDAIEITSALESFIGENQVPFLIDARNLKFVEASAMAHFSCGSHTRFISAQALLVDSLTGKALATFFLRVYRPPYPVKVFSCKKTAIDWLKKTTAITSHDRA